MPIVLASVTVVLMLLAIAAGAAAFGKRFRLCWNLDTSRLWMNRRRSIER
jgi:hypothetical protein